MSESIRIPRRRNSKGNGQFMFSALILVLVIASLLSMYFYLEEQKKQNKLEVEVIAEKIERIEDKLSITNEDSAQNMDTVSDQLSFIDKEVRKLWGHRKGYLENFKKQENTPNHLRMIHSTFNYTALKIKHFLESIST